MSRFFCYRNLHKRPKVVYSLKSMSNNLVESHKEVVILKDVQFKVSLSGNARVRRLKQKHVHAGVVGEVVESFPNTLLWRKARYNPYDHTTFIDVGTEQPIYNADYAVLKSDGLYYSLIDWQESPAYLKHIDVEIKVG